MKMIILASQLTKSSSCVKVTLGVGNNIDAELWLHKLAPHCKLYAVLQSGDIFSEVGKYFQVAVGA
jgi:hypothetical protein